MADQTELTPAEQAALLNLARTTIRDLVQGRQPATPQSDLPGLQQAGGAFVSLHKHGQLRGCIGNFVSSDPLMKTVQAMSVAAASQDPRFKPVQAAELDDLSIEISVLTPLRQINSEEEIEVGRDGIYIVNPRGRGVLLPQVAVEHGWDRRTFLQQTARKAGLPAEAWADPDSMILTFSAQIFGDEPRRLA